MTQEAIQLLVYRRNGQFIVGPGALSDTGFRGLHDLLVVENVPNGLLHALEAGERAARAATALPRKDRFRGKPNWKAVGAADWNDFVKGTSSVDIVRDDKLTELIYKVHNTRDMSLTAAGITAELGPGTPMADVARAVVEMFERGDRELPSR